MGYYNDKFLAAYERAEVKEILHEAPEKPKPKKAKDMEDWELEDAAKRRKNEATYEENSPGERRRKKIMSAVRDVAAVAGLVTTAGAIAKTAMDHKDRAARKGETSMDRATKKLADEAAYDKAKREQIRASVGRRVYKIERRGNVARTGTRIVKRPTVAGQERLLNKIAGKSASGAKFTNASVSERVKKGEIRIKRRAVKHSVDMDDVNVFYGAANKPIKGKGKAKKKPIKNEWKGDCKTKGKGKCKD